MTWNRASSLIVAIAYLLFFFIDGSEGTWPIMLAFLMLPLMCIWFGAELGDFTGLGPHLIYISNSSPGILIRIIGWVLLLMPGAVLYLWR